MSPPAPARAVARLAVATLVLLAGTLAAPSAAWAHAELQGAEPAAGAEVERPPEQVRAWFDEAVEPVGAGLEVVGPDGIRVDRDDAAHAGGPHELAVSLEDGLPAGTYTVRWRVQAGDSHVQEDDWTFTVAAATDDAGAPTGAAGDGDDPASAAPRGDEAGHRAADEPDTRFPGAQLALAALGGLLAVGGGVVVVRRQSDETADRP